MLQNCRPWKFYGRFSVLTAQFLQNFTKLQTLEVLRSVFSTHTLQKIENVTKLPASEVLRSLLCLASITADLGSFTVGFQWCETFRWKTADLGSSTVTFLWWQKLTIKLPASAVLRSLSKNCRPWKFYGRFSVMTKCDGRTASLGSFVDTGWGTWGVLESSSFKERVHLCKVTTN